MAPDTSDPIKPSMFKGFALIGVGIMCFFGTIPLALFYSDGGAGFVCVFFAGFIGSSIILASGAMLLSMAQRDEKVRRGTVQQTANLSQHRDFQTPSHDPRDRQSFHPQPVPLVIQNIGNYVEGSSIDIRDSVINRSNIGGGATGQPEATFRTDAGSGRIVSDGDRTTLLDEYRRLLMDVWKDGKLTPEELAFLDSVREQRSISAEEHQTLEREILVVVGNR